jgi:ABC-2 type transport system ATP-binding protein
VNGEGDERPDDPTGQAASLGIVQIKDQDPLAAKSQMAFVSENVMLYGNFTALQNLEYFAQLGGKKNYRVDDFREEVVFE